MGSPRGSARIRAGGMGWISIDTHYKPPIGALGIGDNEGTTTGLRRTNNCGIFIVEHYIEIAPATNLIIDTHGDKVGNHRLTNSGEESPAGGLYALGVHKVHHFNKIGLGAGVSEIS